MLLAGLFGDWTVCWYQGTIYQLVPGCLNALPVPTRTPLKSQGTLPTLPWQQKSCLDRALVKVQYALRPVYRRGSAITRRHQPPPHQPSSRAAVERGCRVRLYRSDLSRIAYRTPLLISLTECPLSLRRCTAGCPSVPHTARPSVHGLATALKAATEPAKGRRRHRRPCHRGKLSRGNPLTESCCRP